MGVLGHFALALGLGLAVYGAVASAWGAARGRPVLVESARTTAYSLAAVVAAANAAMLAALLANDFSIAYVALNSSRATPTFFKVLALWSADEGSLLLWNLVLAGFLAAVAFRLRRRRPETFPWALSVLYAVAVFYLALVVGPADPFAGVAAPPFDGRGPLPLLQNHPLMAAHPPMLYLGFVGMTVPFAFAMAAIVTGRVTGWLGVARRWTLVAWIFLTAGLILGALWSYGVLGWGGYWAWDPVENVALLPWLTATAFLHSAMLQERRGMAPAWNLSLVVATFALVTLGTFLTRGSILASVHAFAESLVGPMYLAFLAAVLVAGFGGIAWRSGRVEPGRRVEGLLSRDAAFMANNLVLVTVAFVVLVGTMFPLAVEALTGRRITVGGPYFSETTVPLFLLLLFLMAAGVVLPWRRASAERVRARLTVPATAAAAVIVALVAVGVRHPTALAAFGLAGAVTVSNVAELIRGGRLRGPGRRRAGGLVAHVGVALAAVAITASSTFGTQREVTLSRGQLARIGDYTVRYEGARLLREPHRDVVVADVSVRTDGVPPGAMTPSLNLYPGASQPIGTPAVRYGAVEDLYVSVVAFEGEGSRAAFRLYVNPGVGWLWVGGIVVVAGGLVSAWPRRGGRGTRPLARSERTPTLERVG